MAHDSELVVKLDDGRDVVVSQKVYRLYYSGEKITKGKLEPLPEDPADDGKAQMTSRQNAKPTIPTEKG